MICLGNSVHVKIFNCYWLDSDEFIYFLYVILRVSHHISNACATWIYVLVVDEEKTPLAPVTFYYKKFIYTFHKNSVILLDILFF